MQVTLPYDALGKDTLLGPPVFLTGRETWRFGVPSVRAGELPRGPAGQVPCRSPKVLEMGVR